MQRRVGLEAQWEREREREREREMRKGRSWFSGVSQGDTETGSSHVPKQPIQMRPGVPLAAIHGKQKQMKRMAIFADFCAKRHGVYFSLTISLLSLSL